MTVLVTTTPAASDLGQRGALVCPNVLQTSLNQTPAKSYPYWDVISRASLGTSSQLPCASLGKGGCEVQSKKSNYPET